MAKNELTAEQILELYNSLDKTLVASISFKKDYAEKLQEWSTKLLEATSKDNALTIANDILSTFGTVAPSKAKKIDKEKRWSVVEGKLYFTSKAGETLLAEVIGDKVVVNGRKGPDSSIDAIPEELRSQLTVAE